METKQKRSFKSFLLDFLKGISLGVSAAIAGLSAGTIAVVEGCYDSLVGAVSSLRKNFKKSFLFLLPYALGLLLGALLALVGIQRGYKAAPFSLTSLFAGLIFGSLPVAIKELKRGANAKERVSHSFSFLFCLLLAAGLGIMTALLKWQLSFFQEDGTLYWWVYILAVVGGFIGAFACVVPGISGSMSLMVIGVYYPLLNTFTGSDAIWHSGNSLKITLGIVMLFLFAIGALGGVFFGSKSMKYLLNKHRVTTFFGIFGLILGSLVSMYLNSSIFPYYTGTEIAGKVYQIQTWDYIVGSILFVLAAIFMFLLLHYLNKKKASEEANS